MNTTSTADRLWTAFGALLLSIPVSGLSWVVTNRWFAEAGKLIPFWPFAVASIALAILAFINHRVAGDVFGRAIAFCLKFFWQN